MIHTSKVTKADSLTPQEVALAQVIQRAINTAWGRVDEREIARALRDLNATQVNQIVDSLSIRLSDRAIVNQLSRAVTSSVGATAKNIRAVLRGQNNNLPRQVNPLNAGEFINLDPTNLPSYLRPTLTEFNFRTTDPRAILYATTRAGVLVTAVDNSTRDSIRQIIARSFTDQVTVRETAKILKNVVGLHPRWANAVYDYRGRLIDQYEEQGLTRARATARADEMSGKYRTTLVRARANMIARTEILEASNRGRYLGWTQAFEGGLVDGATKKMWITAPVDVCDICLDLQGEVVGWNSPFTNGDLMPPAHPNCRCTSVLIPPDRGTITPEELQDEFVEEF